MFWSSAAPELMAFLPKPLRPRHLRRFKVFRPGAGLRSLMAYLAPRERPAESKESKEFLSLHIFQNALNFLLFEMFRFFKQHPLQIVLEHVGTLGKWKESLDWTNRLNIVRDSFVPKPFHKIWAICTVNPKKPQMLQHRTTTHCLRSLAKNPVNRYHPLPISPPLSTVLRKKTNKPFRPTSPLSPPSPDVRRVTWTWPCGSSNIPNDRHGGSSAPLCLNCFFSVLIFDYKTIINCCFCCCFSRVYWTL